MTEIKSAKLEIVSATIPQIPKETVPEFVFAGKSNVGKSSLINTLTNRNKLARTSSEPGKTRTINFYLIDDSIRFVDLPGYGYAKTARAEQERFSKVIDAYLEKRPAIAAIFLLVDIRHEPGENDLMMLDWMRAYGYRPVIIATKADKLSKAQCQRQLAMLGKALQLSEQEKILPFSAFNRQGKEELLDFIRSLAAH